MDLNIYGSHNPFNWTQKYLYEVLFNSRVPVVKNIVLKKAFAEIDRSDFIKENQKQESYDDKDLILDFNQKLTRPTTIALMLEKLELREWDRVLEIGTGSGYVLALLSSAVGEKGQVIGVEREQYLLDFARNNLAKYPELKNYELFFRDGSKGLPERAPYDRILISAIVEEPDEQLKNQVSVGGIIVYPKNNYTSVKLKRVKEDQWKEEEFFSYFEGTLSSGIS